MSKDNKNLESIKFKIKNQGGNMKNKDNLVKITLFMLLITLLAIILVSGTYAKFTTVASGADTAVVAKWSFKVNNNEIAVEGDPKTVEFGLFSTINDSDGVNGETDVKSGLIAPGTTGKFDFVLQNTSDVTAQYTIDFEVTNPNEIPVQFSTDGVNWSTDLNDITRTQATILNIGSEAKNVTIQWKWPFRVDDENNTVDTNLGKVAANSDQAPEITVKATVNAEQLSQSLINYLKANYELSYYNDIDTALARGAVNSTEEAATFATYTDENGKFSVVLLKDATVDETASVSQDVNINLAGSTLISNAEVAIDVTSGNVGIIGTSAGSRILATNNTGAKATAVKVTSGDVSINGGTYETNTKGAGTKADPNSVMAFEGTGNLTVSNVTVNAKDTDGGTAQGIYVAENTSVTVSNADIVADSANGLDVAGINNNGTMTVLNSNINGYSNYTANEAVTDYATRSMGISNNGTMIIKDSYVWGNHSGIRSEGELYVDGGTYEGYGHGGIYFCHTGKTSYVKNATIRESEIMKNGYYDDGDAGTNHAGMYIGSGTNIIVYMDNCELSGKYYPAVLRSSGGESGSHLYISNSNINDCERYIRVDRSGNKIHVGTGNNFTVVSAVYYESNGEDTDVDYGAIFPEY